MIFFLLFFRGCSFLGMLFFWGMIWEMLERRKDGELMKDIGLLRLLPLPRHLSRRTRQDVPNDRSRRLLRPAILTTSPPHLHHLRPRPRHPRRPGRVPFRIPPRPRRTDRDVGANQGRV